MSAFLAPLAGGALIGVAVTLMLLFNGRVVGISGIIAESMKRPPSFWRWSFLLGLLAGGAVLKVLDPSVFANTTGRELGSVLVAGLLVGYGTVMGSGCTSGHGVCGISRLSLRSIIATGIFIAFGVGAVQIANLFLGGD